MAGENYWWEGPCGTELEADRAERGQAGRLEDKAGRYALRKGDQVWGPGGTGTQSKPEDHEEKVFALHTHFSSGEDVLEFTLHEYKKSIRWIYGRSIIIIKLTQIS